MMISLLAFHPEFYKLQMILSDETVGTNAVTSLVHPFFQSIAKLSSYLLKVFVKPISSDRSMPSLISCTQCYVRT